jgi:hypothetical protein
MSNFMDTFFFLSLGITFALILLLVYHFKQRFSNTEQKCDTMFEIINGMASELNSIKGFLTSRPTSNIQDTGIPLSSLFSQMSRGQSTHQTNGGENNMISIVEGSDDEDDEDGSDDSDDSDDSNDSDNEDVDFPIESIDEDEGQSKIVVSDTDDIPIHEQTLSAVETDVSTSNFQKMTLANLKSYAIENGLVESSSKMRKSDLIDLIQTAK